MKKTKRFLAILLAAAMLVPMTVGCSNSGEAEGGTSGGGTADGGSGAKPVVRMVVPGISEQSTTDPISGLTSLGLGDFEKFLEEKIPDVDINLISIPWDGWIQKIEAMSTANEMDVAFFTNQVAVPDWYMDLTPYLEKDPDVNFDNLSEWFLEPAVHYTTYKSFNYPEATGKVYGLPLTMACNSIVYDKQLFEDWGVEEPQPDDTMDDLIAKAAQMTGTNPKTGKTNYGAYATSMWMEWYAISYDAVKPYSSDTMMLNELDMDEYVNYNIIKDIGLSNNFFGVILPGVMTNAMFIFFIKQFCDNLPSDLYEAGVIDGASKFRIYAQIFLPLMGPVVATLVVLDVVNVWNDLLWPMIVLTDVDLSTIQLGLVRYNTGANGQVHAGIQTALSVLSVLPLGIIFCFMQKYIVQSIAASGLKQ